MILSGKEIVRHMGEEIIIDPFDPKRVNPNSYNLTLSDELMVYDNYELDMKKRNEGTLLHIPEEGYVLQPNKLYLGLLKNFLAFVFQLIEYILHLCHQILSLSYLQHL